MVPMVPTHSRSVALGARTNFLFLAGGGDLFLDVFFSIKPLGDVPPVEIQGRGGQPPREARHARRTVGVV